VCSLVVSYYFDADELTNLNEVFDVTIFVWSKQCKWKYGFSWVGWWLSHS